MDVLGIALIACCVAWAIVMASRLWAPVPSRIDWESICRKAWADSIEEYNDLSHQRDYLRAVLVKVLPSLSPSDREIADECLASLPSEFSVLPLELAKQGVLYRMTLHPAKPDAVVKD